MTRLRRELQSLFRIEERARSATGKLVYWRTDDMRRNNLYFNRADRNVAYHGIRVNQEADSDACTSRSALGVFNTFPDYLFVSDFAGKANGEAVLTGETVPLGVTAGVWRRVPLAHDDYIAEQPRYCYGAWCRDVVSAFVISSLARCADDVVSALVGAARF